MIISLHWALGLLLCIVLGVVFVGVLYLVPPQVRRLPRDDPRHIRWRIVTTLASGSISVIVVTLLTKTGAGPNLMAWLAFPGHNTLAAVGIALLLTMLLFLGPIVQTSLTLRWAWSQGHSTLQVMLPDAEDNPMILIRNLVAAPLAEEIVFRACMTPILIGAGMGPIAIIFICPLFFGVAHVHHVFELVKQGHSWKQSIISCVAQFTFTSLFGMYAEALLLRTGNVAAPVAAHIFCNCMGVPRFSFIAAKPGEREHKLKTLLAILYVIGLVGFAVSVVPATNPAMYNSELWAAASA